MQRLLAVLLLLVFVSVIVGGILLVGSSRPHSGAPEPTEANAVDPTAEPPAPVTSTPTPAATDVRDHVPGALADGWYPCAGTVVDSEGAPVAGAFVSLEMLRKASQSSTGNATDDAGRFSLNLRGDGLLTARAQHPDVGSAELSMQVDEGSREAVRSLRLVLEPRMSITGRVQDEKGAPVAGATITGEIHSLDASRHTYVRAGSHADGSFRILGLRAGQARLNIEHEEHVAAEVECTVGADGLLVTMARGARVSGVVTDDRGQPVAEASVIVRRPDRFDGFSYDSPRIGSDGRFELHGLPREQLRIHAVAVGFQEAVPIDIDLREVHDLADLELRLSRGLGLAGAVVDQAGQPVGEAQVGVERMPDARLDGGGGRSPRWITTSEADGQGRFEVSGLEEGREYALHAQHKGFVPEADAASRQVVAPGRGDIVLVLDSGGSISGHVTTIDGAPVEGARVTLVGRGRGPGGTTNDQYTMTDADGGYAIHGVAAGERKLRCTSEHHAEAEPMLVQIGAGEHLTRIDIVLDPPPEGVLSGRVTDQDGEPVVGASLSFRRVVETRDRPSSPGARTGAEGRFRVERVEDMEYELSFNHPGHLLPGERPRLRPGTPVELEVLRLGLVTGRIVDGAGEPVAGARLTFERAHDSMIMTGRQRKPPETGAYGTFELVPQRDPMGISGLHIEAPAGHASMTVACDFADATTDVDLGDIVLQSGLAVEGHVLSNLGTPVAQARLWLSPARSLPAKERDRLSRENTESDGEGSFRLEGLLPGEYELTIQHPEHLSKRIPHTVAAGATPLRIELGTGGGLRGRVTGADGKPVAGARVSVAHQRAETDAEGLYQVGGIVAGSHHVGVDIRTGAGSISVSKAIEHPGVGELVCDLGGWPSACEVHGRVVGMAAGNDPASLRRINLRGEVDGEAIGVEARLDAELRFRFPPVPPGTYELSMYRLHTQTVDVPASSSYELRVTLASGSIAGTVLRSDGGPIRHATVRGMQYLDGEYQEFRDARVDGAGHFSLPNASPGAYGLVVSVDGYGYLELERFELGAGQHLDGLQITVVGGGNIDVRVLDPAGEPVSEGYVAFLDESGNPPFGGSSATRQSPGTYRLAGLPPGRWHVFAGAQPHGTASLEGVNLAEGETTQVKIQLPADAHPMHLRITDAGKPVHRAWVTLRDAQGRPVLDLAGPGTGSSTRADGTFTTGPLPTGTYEVRVRYPGEEEARTQQIRLPQTEEVVELAR